MPCKCYPFRVLHISQEENCREAIPPEEVKMAITASPEFMQYMKARTNPFRKITQAPPHRETPRILSGQVTSPPPLPQRQRDHTGLDDTVGRTMQAAGAAVALVPDPVIFAAALAASKNPVFATKAAVSINLVGLGLIGLGGAVRYLD